MPTINVEQSEPIRMVSMECSITFCLSCYSSFEASNGLEALFSLISELLSSAAISPALFSIAKTSFPGSTGASFTTGLLYTPSFVRTIANRITPSDPSMVSVTRLRL